jgi:hypothetical protein
VLIPMVAVSLYHIPLITTQYRLLRHILGLVTGIQEKCCELEASCTVNIQTGNVFVLTNRNKKKTIFIPQ